MPGIVDTKILLVTSLVTKLVLHQCGVGGGRTNGTIWRVCDLFFVFIDPFSQQPSISCKLADCWFLSWGLEARGLGIVCAPCLSAGS